jgi:hypothetical protein
MTWVNDKKLHFVLTLKPPATRKITPIYLWQLVRHLPHPSERKNGTITFGIDSPLEVQVHVKAWWDRTGHTHSHVSSWRIYKNKKQRRFDVSFRSLFDSVRMCVCVCFFLLPTCSRVYVGFASVTHRLSILTSINIWVQSSRRTSTPQHLKTYIDFDFRGKIVRNKLRAFSGGAFYSKMEAHARRRAFGKGEIGLANKN